MRGPRSKTAKEAELAIARATPVVKGLTTPLDAATRAATSLARAESLYAAMDYPLAAPRRKTRNGWRRCRRLAPQPAADRSDSRDRCAAPRPGARRGERAGDEPQTAVPFYDRAGRDELGELLPACLSDSRRVSPPMAFDVHGNTADAMVRCEYRFVPKGGGAQREERAPMEMQFTRTPTGWRV